MRGVVLLVLAAGCGSAATIEAGSYTLVGARTTNEQTMEPWAGAPVTLEVGVDTVVLDVDGARTTLTPSPWPRSDWVDGCWTMQGSTAQEVWDLACDTPLDLGDGVVVPCPLALLSGCPEGRELVIRERPVTDDGGSGCGTSPVCLQFAPER